jgi:hypothetical protein
VVLLQHQFTRRIA